MFFTPAGKLLFCPHAQYRLSVRSRLSEEGLATIYQQGLGVRICGCPHDPDRQHTLFWSPSDSEFLVLIHSISANLAVTVLTAKMYQHSHPNLLTDDFIAKFRNQLVYNKALPRAHWRPRDSKEQVQVSVQASERPSPYFLSVSTRVSSLDPLTLETSEAFWATVFKKLSSRKIPLDEVASVKVALIKDEWATLEHRCHVAPPSQGARRLTAHDG